MLNPHKYLAGRLLVASLIMVLVGCDASSVTGLNESPIGQSTGIMPSLRMASSMGDDLEKRLAELAPTGSTDFFRMPLSSRLDLVPQDPLNPLTKSKVQLGQLLFHETAMGVNSLTGNPQTFSCASCHFAQAGFQAALAQGVADGGAGFGMRINVHGTASDIQPIRTPSAMNAAYQNRMLWNGQFGGEGNEGFGNPAQDFVELNREGFQGLEVQAIKGLQVHRMEDGAGSVVDLKRYEVLFRRAFGEDEFAVSRRNAGLAIAAFERTLLANRAPFQRWLQGNPIAMSEEEYRGALVFFGEKASCASCHTGPALNSDSFHALGMNDLDVGAPDLIPNGFVVPRSVRLGRGGFTGNASEDYQFKTPQLYNLVDSRFYGHGASLRTVRDVVEYKNAGVAENPLATGLSPQFVPLGLSKSEVDDLVAFLETGLRDPDLGRYVPQAIPSHHCTPVNDETAQSELKCSTGPAD